MKPYYIFIFTRTALAVATILAVTACAHGHNDYYAPAPYDSPYMTYHDYWYYPAIRSYYDTHSRVYFYFERDRWIRARHLPPHLRSHPGRHVTIRSPHDRPYKEHHRHREQYRPERYRHAEPGDRGRDIRHGDRNRELLQRHSRGRNQTDGGRDKYRRDAARERNGDRKLGPLQSDYHKQRREYQRQHSATRRQEAAGRRESPTSAGPAKHTEKARERANRKEKPRSVKRTPHRRPQVKDLHEDRPYQDAGPGSRGNDPSYWDDAATNL